MCSLLPTHMMMAWYARASSSPLMTYSVVVFIMSASDGKWRLIDVWCIWVILCEKGLNLCCTVAQLMTVFNRQQRIVLIRNHFWHTFPTEGTVNRKELRISPGMFNYISYIKLHWWLKGNRETLSLSFSITISQWHRKFTSLVFEDGEGQ